MRYLHGVVKNKRVSASLWLKPEQLPEGVRKYGTVVYRLLQEGSHMTTEVVHAHMVEAVGELDANAFMDAAGRCDVSGVQLRELHNYIFNDYVLRRGRDVLTGFLGDMKRPGALDFALEELRSLKALQPSKQVSLGSQMAGAVKEAFDGAKNLIRYGYPTMDRRLGGGTRGEITVLAARPGHCKTSFTIQLMLNWSKMGYKVICFSLEMPTGKLIHKMISNQAGIPGYKIRTGKMDDVEKERLTRAAEEFVVRFKDNLLIYDDVYTVREMETIVAKHKPDVVVVDFIQLVQMDSDMRTGLFKAMSHLKRIAKEYNLNVFALSQLNRAIEGRDDPIPRLSDLAESGSLEQLAGDVAFLWYAHKFDRDAPANRIDVYFQKTRYGEMSQFGMLFDGSVMTFKERQADMRQMDMEEQIERQRAEEAAHAGQQRRDGEVGSEAAN